MQLKGAIEAELQAANLQLTPYSVTKAIQLYETKGSRHSVMIVGNTKSGKSVIWRTLQAGLTRLSKDKEAGAGPGEQIVYNKVSVGGRERHTHSRGLFTVHCALCTVHTKIATRRCTR